MELAGKVIAVLEPRGGVSKTGNEELNVFFDVDAREWNGRWFNSIRAWKVERVGAQGPVAPDAPFPPMNAAPAAPVDFAATDEKDDLPF